jgi:hypothetical protein
MAIARTGCPGRLFRLMVPDGTAVQGTEVR